MGHKDPTQFDFSFFRTRSRSEKGYALTSVLFLITILSLVILSILAVKYFQRQQAQMEIARVKADYAAQNNISALVAELNTNLKVPGYGQMLRRDFDWQADGKGRISLEWWGLYLLARSEGMIGKISEKRTALLGERPKAALANALVFANTNHQLVLTGLSTIRGDVITGPAGVAIGTMKDYATPRRIPVEGRIRRVVSVKMPIINVKDVLDYFNGLLQGRAPQGIDPKSADFNRTDAEAGLSNSNIPISRQYLFVKGNARFDSVLSRRDVPLTIAVDGHVRFAPNARIEGLVCIASTQSIEIERNVALDEAVLYSGQGIRLMSGCDVTAQLIASTIEIAPLARASYPSVLFSYVSKSPKEAGSGITVGNGALVEGSVIGIGEDESRTQPIMKIESGTRIRGFILCSGTMTLDGTVSGCVITKDLYFYESPTTYLGWLRSARIDRIQCPQTMLSLPMSDSLSLAVQDWL